MLTDDVSAVIERKEFDRLPEYSCSLPTGTILGKVWKRRVPYLIVEDEPCKWYLGEYYDDGTPDQVAIRWREILLVD